MDNQNPQATSQPGAPETKPADSPTQTTPLNWDTLKQYVPAEYKDAGVWETLQGKDVSVLLKNYAEQAKYIGGSVKIPKPEDKDGWQKVYSKLGRPENKDGYKYDFPEHTKIDWNTAAYEKMRDRAWENGLTQDQFKAQMDLYTGEFMESANKAMQEQNEREEKARNELKTKYGQNYEYNRLLAAKAAEQYFPKDIAEAIAEEMTISPGLFEGLFKLGTELSESGTFGNVSPGELGGLSYDAAQEKIQALNRDREHPYWNKNHPDHKSAVAQAQTWFKVKRPS